MLQVSTETLERLLPAVDEAIRAGDPARAHTLCRQILASVPHHARALQRLGLALALLGRHGEAVAAFRASLAAAPHPDTWNDLGSALAALGNMAESRQAFEKSLAIEPGHLRARLGLAHVLIKQGAMEAAAEEYQRILESHPDCFEAALELGRVWINLGQHARAVAPLEKAAAALPDNPEVYNDLGVAYQFSGRSSQAIAAFERSIAIQPRFLAAHSNLGNEYKFQGRLCEAAESYQRSIACNPQFAEPHNNLAAVLMVMARAHQAAEVYRQAIVLKPDFEAARSGYLYCLNFLSGIEPAQVYHEHRQWECFCAAPAESRFSTYDNERSPQRRLRVGYVSADFREHPVAAFMQGILAGHQRSDNAFEVFCYADPLMPDAVTERLCKLAHHWRTINGWPHERVARQVRADGIDILVDLHGHTGGGRLRLFTMKPAPVQVTYLGYPPTTGLSAIDYRITDGWADPAGQTDRYHSEKLVRLPETFLCFRPLREMPPQPSRTDQPVIFVSFNALSKLTPQSIELWAGILQEAQSSRLMLKTVGLQDSALRAHVTGLFVEHGIHAERLILLPPTPSYPDHLATYERADIALDTFPYHGTTTTCEALYMGVPVVTLAGKVHAGRVGVSILNNVGLPELVAGSPEEYRRVAVALAGDPERRRELRATLRRRMENSPLMDAARFVQNLEAAYRTMWQSWCKT